MANFIPSGAGGTLSIVEFTNSEKLSGIRPYFSTYFRSWIVNGAWIAP